MAFLVADADGATVGSSNGQYITDQNGRIVVGGLQPGLTVVAREIRTVEGTTAPIPGTEFRVAYANGRPVENHNGVYITNDNGKINIVGVTGTVVITHGAFCQVA